MDIRDAVLDSSNILPSQLKGYSSQLTADGEAYALKGGFALSIKVIKSGSKAMCLRCWVDGKADESQIDYLEEVAGVIHRNSDKECPYFIDFNIVERLLRVNGVELPGLLMDWVEGETLNKYVMANSGHSATHIRQQARNFAKMCDVFNRRQICHGDLSAVNIIVRPDGSLRVIDYDSLYAPSMGRKRQFIAGIKDYQHPKREAASYYETYTDYFSQHIIYTALLIMSYDANARPKQQLKNLLFSENDLVSQSKFRTSEVVTKARKLNVAEINSELDIIEKALGGAFSAVPRLSVSGFVDAPSVLKMPYCTACGAKFPDDRLNFCTQCGNKRLEIKR